MYTYVTNVNTSIPTGVIGNVGGLWARAGRPKPPPGRLPRLCSRRAWSCSTACHWTGHAIDRYAMSCKLIETQALGLSVTLGLSPALSAAQSLNFQTAAKTMHQSTRSDLFKKLGAMALKTALGIGLNHFKLSWRLTSRGLV